MTPSSRWPEITSGDFPEAEWRAANPPLSTVHMAKCIRGHRSALCDVSHSLPRDAVLTDNFDQTTCAECEKWVTWLSGCFGPT